jgi:hypothetical protein
MVSSMLGRLKSIFREQEEFSRRIKHRHRLFWSPHNAEDVRNTIMSSEDSMEKWQDVAHWQRKLSNKYNAKQFAIKMGCNVANLYWKGRDVHTIDFNHLPKQYVIRPTVGHSSGNVFVMNDGYNLFDNRSYEAAEIRGKLALKLAEKPRLEFLIEEFLQEEPDQYKVLNDYKFFCFNGEIASCQLINRLGPKAGFGSFYDEHWNPMEAVHPGYTLVAPKPRPECLEEMVQQVKILSEAYKIFCRIDFYATTKGAVFGEFTPTPGMGEGYSKFGQRLLLNYWDKYCAGLV